MARGANLFARSAEEMTAEDGTKFRAVQRNEPMAMDEEGADIKQVANFAILAGDWQPEVGATFTTEAGETYRVQRVGEVRQTGLASFYDIEGIRP